MTLRLKERELVAVGASVAAGCMPCTDFHVVAARRAKAMDEDIRQAIADALCVRRSAAEVMEAHGLSHLGDTSLAEECGCSGKTTRIKELISIGAAFAVNCTLNLEKHLAAAATVEITADEVQSVVELAGLIKGQAVSHVEKLAGASAAQEIEQARAATGGCCCNRPVTFPGP